ncbi:uncharacterized protein LOC130654878 isoform X2 [Hydractinia symbiolongicarpus]|uniref:uncharacterized protein LOC130654878 isoform X2 n=1 Tax=Hydractinia symbiolongicarpus TaxID=13093 RepID=UPI00254F22C0|nr:uncharacterized protein LOC130654878 isoform X2 [Hydractinia symbiolongicarpus]
MSETFFSWKSFLQQLEKKLVYSGLQRDSGARLQSANDSPIFPRAPGYDTSRLVQEIEVKRRSLELEKRIFASPPSRVERDYASGPTRLERDELREAEYISAYTRKEEATKKERKEYVEFPDEVRPRTQSVGPTEAQLREAAQTIANVGDQIEREYGGRMQIVEEDLKTFLRTNGNLSYEVFAAHVNDLIGEDRNWTNFMFIMHLSKRVITTTKSVSVNTFAYFRQFVGSAFAEQVAQQEDVVNFVKKKDSEAS